MKKWKVALIGCGSIADNTYLPRIGEIPEADLVAVCDIIPERAKNYAEKFHVPAWYTSIDELLEKCDFEILMNTTSIPAHHEINMKALRAGKHLYSQKPVGLTVEEVTEQIEAAKAAGVKYTASPIHMLRDDIRFAKKLIADGCIGEIMKVHTNVCHGGPEYFQYRTADPTWFHRPGSGLYAEVVRNTDLVEQLQREFKIIITGPTTLAAILNSLQMGFKTLAIQKRSSEVWEILGAVKTEFSKFGGILDRAQKKINEASNDIDQLVSTRTKAIERKLKKVQELPQSQTIILLDNGLIEEEEEK